MPKPHSAVRLPGYRYLKPLTEREKEDGMICREVDDANDRMQIFDTEKGIEIVDGRYFL